MNSLFKAADHRTLYVSRRLKNADEFIAWAKSQGFSTTLQPGDLHVTVAFSKTPMEWPGPSDREDPLTIYTGGKRSVVPLGDGGAVVLRFESYELERRWQELRDLGASWDHDGYHPHVTISWDADDVDLSKVEPFDGELAFGPERFAEIDENWRNNVTEKHATIVKADDEQRMAYGWASVISEKGEPVVDTQDDVIEAHELVKATTEFMADARMAKAMHKGGKVGEVLHSFPLTAELAKSLGISSDREGWIVGVKVHDDGIWKRVKSGELRAFSIGGAGARVPVEGDA